MASSLHISRIKKDIKIWKVWEAEIAKKIRELRLLKKVTATRTRAYEDILDRAIAREMRALKGYQKARNHLKQCLERMEREPEIGRRAKRN